MQHSERAFLVFILLTVLLPERSYAFTSCLNPARLSSTRRRQLLTPSTSSPRKTFNKLSVKSSPFSSSFTEAENEDAKKDNPFTVGAIVRVAAEDTKAYQVNPKAFGKFDANKKFIPAKSGGERGTKNLLIPVGMRGVVTKVYDVNDVSANFPVQVKFTPGENVDEGYDPPVTFIMHFEPEELELV